MTTLGPQDLLVAALALAAAAWLARRAWRRRKRAAVCAGCDDCPAARVARPPLVHIETASPRE